MNLHYGDTITDDVANNNTFFSYEMKTTGKSGHFRGETISELNPLQQSSTRTNYNDVVKNDRKQDYGLFSQSATGNILKRQSCKLEFRLKLCVYVYIYKYFKPIF